MAFDAAMVTAIVRELNEKIIDARVEKVTQPEKDELVLLLHAGRENLRLALSSGSNNPRFHLTGRVKENPAAPPMFCMLLRKHLTGAHIRSITQLGFERAVEFAFEGTDEMGFRTNRYLITETMGKYSNIILLNAEKKVVSALKIIDLTSGNRRQILPGFPYELPPVQTKQNPLDADRAAFDSAYEAAGEQPCDQFLMSTYYGFAPVTAREIACRASGSSDRSVSSCDREKLWATLQETVERLKNGSFEPWLVTDAAGKPIEYFFSEPFEYPSPFEKKKLRSFGELLDEYFGKRDRAERIRQRTSDLFRVLTNAESRINKKIALQKQDLLSCGEKEKYRLYGDLITANIYRLSRGMESAALENYTDDGCETLTVPLDKRLTPPQNAQKYYKKYNKFKTAEVELQKQIALAEKELSYLYTVFDSLTRAENENDVLEIREELSHSGYASRMKQTAAKKLPAPKPMSFLSTDGKKILCGKNNHQNDYLTTRVADKNDYWFHVKDQPGSHCILVTDGEEPSDRDFTEAAVIAAYYSKASESQNVAVDYTLVRNVRKPNGAKPGFVTYQTNYTAFVTPDEKLVLSLKK